MQAHSVGDSLEEAVYSVWIGGYFTPQGSPPRHVQALLVLRAHASELGPVLIPKIGSNNPFHAFSKGYPESQGAGEGQATPRRFQGQRIDNLVQKVGSREGSGEGSVQVRSKAINRPNIEMVVVVEQGIHAIGYARLERKIAYISPFADFHPKRRSQGFIHVVGVLVQNRTKYISGGEAHRKPLGEAYAIGQIYLGEATGAAFRDAGNAFRPCVVVAISRAILYRWCWHQCH